MRILIAMDSFKGSLSSMAAGAAVKEAIHRLDRSVDVQQLPLADGGEGTVDALTAGCDGKQIQIPVTDPLGAQVLASYGILPDGTAVLEMAAAAGLPLVPPEKRDPMHTTTYGVGELIRDAIDRGCRNFIIGIGGSATNDGGTGMLSALGFRFLDEKGMPIPPGAKGLARLERVEREGAMPQLQECTFRIACDVKNPLCGPEGCSAVFAPQKGAKAEDIPQMDRWLYHFSQLSGTDPNLPGAGAAGGLGYGFCSYLGGKLEPGVQIILEQTGMEEAVCRADLVITGEGRLDGQTAMGKAPMGVATLAKKYGKPVVAFCGCVGEGVQRCKDWGITAYYPITPPDMPSQVAMKPEVAYENLKNKALQVLKLQGKGMDYENY